MSMRPARTDLSACRLARWGRVGLCVAALGASLTATAHGVQGTPAQGQSGQGAAQGGDGQRGGRGGDRAQGDGRGGDRAQGQGRGGDGAGGGEGGGRGNRGFGMGGGRGGMGAMSSIMTRFQPDFMRRDVPLFQEQLGLDGGQMQIVETLINDYDLEFQPKVEEVRGTMQDSMMRIFRSFMAGDMRERMRGVVEGIQADIEQMEKDGGAPLDEEARRRYFRERMEKVSEEIMAERKATGADAETRGIMKEMFDSMNGWLATKRRMKATVVDGIQATLTDEQRARWPAFERFLRREKTMADSILSGEGTNLLVALDEAQLSQASIDAARKALDDYEMALDAALKAREECLDATEPTMLKSIVDANDREAMQAVDRQIAARKAVRDVNVAFIEQISVAMPADEGAKFANAARAQAFRRVYREDQAARAFSAALAMEGIDPKNADALRQMQQAYQQEISGWNSRLVLAISKEEPTQRRAEIERIVGMMSGTRGMMFGPGFGGNDGPNPVNDLFDQRAAFVNATVERIKSMLTPEQIAALPRGREPGGNQPWGTGRIEDMPEQFRARAAEFDKNKDGMIDEEERRELFRSMRGGGGQGGGDGQGGGGRGGDGQGGGQGGGGRGGRGGNGQGGPGADAPAS